MITSVLESTRLSSPYSLFCSKNEIMLDPPESGKSQLGQIILFYALSNGEASMVTSLAARRANQLRSDHSHRLFGIPVDNVEVAKIAEEASLKLSHGPKGQHPTFLQLLTIE